MSRVSTEKTPPKRRLQQILRVYNPGKGVLARLKAKHRSNAGVADELESKMRSAQINTLKFIKKHDPTVH